MTTTPLAALEPYIAVAAASFKMVTLSIRDGSISYNLVTLISKPSIMKVGKLGLFFKDDLDVTSTSNSLTPIPDLPRIYTSGTEFGSEPQALFSAIRKDGSNACIAEITLLCDTFSNSSFLIVTVLPVKLSFLRLAYPVTTTSSIL